MAFCCGLVFGGVGLGAVVVLLKCSFASNCNHHHGMCMQLLLIAVSSRFVKKNVVIVVGRSSAAFVSSPEKLIEAAPFGSSIKC